MVGLNSMGSTGVQSKQSTSPLSLLAVLIGGITDMRKVAVMLLLALLVVSGSALAQTETGQISGTVVDQQGAAVPKAKVVIRNVNTGAVREASSDEHGSFIVTNLLPADYAILVEAANFSKLEEKVSVPPGGKIALDLKLQLGKITETVEVSESAVSLNAETQTVGDELTSKELKDLPLLTRNPYDLVGTVGNV